MKPQKQPGIKSILVLVVSSVLVAECVKTEDVINPESLKIWEIYNVGNGIGSDSIMSLAEDKEGSIWVGTRNNGVSKFDGIKWTVYNVTSGLLDNAVLCIEQDGYGNMWFGTSGGLSILSNSGWTNIPDLGPIYALLKDHDDNIWLSSGYYGVLIYDNNGWYSNYDYECELCNVVNVLFEDNEHNIWIGSWRDLKKFSGQQVISYTMNNGLPGNTITAIHQDIWGNIWIGIQFSSYVTRLNNGNIDLVDLSNGLSVNFVTSITSDNYGNVWFGLLIKGAHKYNGSMMKPYTLNDGLPDRTVTSIIKDSHGYLWFGTLSGGVVRYMPGMD